MGFFDATTYRDANDVDAFTRSVHSLLSDLYQSSPLQSGTLDKVVSVPDLKPIEVPAGLSAPQQSGLLSSYSPVSSSVPSPLVAAPTATPSIPTPSSPTIAYPSAVGAPAPIAPPAVDTSTLSSPTVEKPKSPLQLLLAARRDELKKYNPLAAAQVEDPNSMVIPTQQELLAALDAKTAAEDKYIEAQKQAMTEGEEIVKEKYQPNWLIVAGALAVGGKRGAAALAGYLKVSQTRFQQDQSARLQVLKDVAEAAKLTAIQAGRPYERLVVANNIAVDQNKYMDDLIKTSEKQLSPILKGALAKSSQNYTLMSIKSGGFLQDPAAFIEQEVANANLPEEYKDAFREELSAWYKVTADSTMASIRSIYLNERYKPSTDRDKVQTSPFADRLVQEDTLSPGVLYPEVDKVMSVVGTTGALRFLPPKADNLAERDALAQALGSANFKNVFKNDSWFSKGNLAPDTWLPIAKKLLQDPEFLADPQNFDILKKYPVKGVTQEAAQQGAEKLRTSLAPVIQAADPIKLQMDRTASTQLAPVGANFREIRDKAAVSYAGLIELAVMPEVRPYVRPEFLALLGKSDPSTLARSLADTVLATKELSGSVASRGVLGMIFGQNVGTVTNMIEKSDGSRDATAASILRTKFKNAVTASYSLASIGQVNTAVVEAAYGNDMSNYFVMQAAGSPTRPVTGYAAELAKSLAIGVSKSVQKSNQIGVYIANPDIKSMLTIGAKEYNISDGGEGGSTPVEGMEAAIDRSNRTPEERQVAKEKAAEAWYTLIQLSEGGKRFDPRFPMAQAAYETGYFNASKSPYETTNNIFGMSVSSPPSKETIAQFAAQGINITGAVPRPENEGGYYYSYATVADCVKHRVMVATDPSKRLSKLGLDAASPEEFAAKAKQVGYYTGDESDYAKGMRTAFNMLAGASYVQEPKPVTQVASAPVKEAPVKSAPTKESTPAPAKEQAKPVKVVTAKDADVKPVLKQIMDANTNLLSGTNPDAAVTKYMDTVTRELKKRGYQLDTNLYAALLKKATEAVRMSVAQRNSSRS